MPRPPDYPGQMGRGGSAGPNAAAPLIPTVIRAGARGPVKVTKGTSTPNGAVAHPDGVLVPPDVLTTVASWAVPDRGSYSAVAIVSAGSPPAGFQMWVMLNNGVHTTGMSGPFSLPPDSLSVSGHSPAQVFGGVTAAVQIIWTADGTPTDLLFDVQFLGTSLS